MRNCAGIQAKSVHRNDKMSVGARYPRQVYTVSQAFHVSVN